MAKIKLDTSTFDKAKKVAQANGYSGVEEFITHIIHSEYEKIDTEKVDDSVVDRLKGLGYIE
ncbi:MAG: hypothetical protein IID32_06730 [Planctomycetes bacterium]|nr:hypothetical protein [Planctomycetota bacterium]